LAQDVIDSVDYYYDNDLNFTGQDKWIYYWDIITNPHSGNRFFPNKKFYYYINDTGLSVFQQMNELTKNLLEYEQVILVNYDTSLEELKLEDYVNDSELILHQFPGQKAYSMIILAYKPKEFFEKVCGRLTYENWIKPERNNQLNEERFYDIIQESGITHRSLSYKLSDKISNEPDYRRPNAPKNEYFDTYLLYHNDAINLEIYLWTLSTIIRNITIEVNDVKFVIFNQNIVGQFEGVLPYILPIEKIKIVQVDDMDIEPVELHIKKGYKVETI
jgi:hypothetical protein